LRNLLPIMKPLLEVKNLTIQLTGKLDHLLVQDVSFELYPNETVCIVGESGSGKTLTAQSILGLLSKELSASGNINFQRKNILNLKDNDLRSIRGNEIAMIFQDPMTALNPVLKVGYQVAEAVFAHHDVSKAEAKKQVLDIFNKIGIPEDRYDSYPDELSGGQRQRIVIAIAIINEPKILIADEPTTALDVTVQMQILNLIQTIRKANKSSILFITHDFGVVKEIADRVIVMFRGRVVESGKVEQVINKPKHPYTKALLACIPSIKNNKKIKPINYKQLDKAIRALGS
jgi:ABC-type dipeptide/oligopeptide/nickel transport system ATPase component